jgi:hypothetical protein
LRDRIRILRLVFLFLIVGGAFIASLADLRAHIQNWNPRNLSDDPVTNWERRIEPVKADLPKSGEIGYLSDWDLPGWKGSQSDMDNEYRLTQYALAPRLLIRGAGYAHVVANLSNPDDISRIEAQFQVRKVHEYGFGIYLFAGSAQ